MNPDLSSHTRRHGARAALAALPALALTTAAVNAQPCGGLLGHWSFTDGSGADSSGNNNTAVRVNAPVIPGVSGQGIQTSFTAGGYAEVANSATLNPTAAITLAVWVADSVGRIGNDAIIDKGATSHSAPFYQYHLGTGGEFIFDLAINGSRTTVRGGAPGPGWTFVVGTYNGSRMRLLVNAVEAAGRDVTGTISTYSRPLRFGRFSNLTTCTDAKIDEVRLYNRALTDSEIQFLYQHPDGQPRVTPATVNICPGAPVTFTLRAVGLGQPGVSVQWRHNGTPIDPAVNPSAVTATLIIPTAADGVGSYDAVITSACGSAVSTSGTLGVTSPCNPSDVAPIGGVPTGSGPCPDGLLTGDDFNAFIAAFAAGDSLADTVGIGGQPPADGLITGDDFNAFIAAFAAGCP